MPEARLRKGKQREELLEGGNAEKQRKQKDVRMLKHTNTATTMKHDLNIETELNKTRARIYYSRLIEIRETSIHKT